MERSLEDIEGGGSPKSPHKRYNVHNVRIYQSCSVAAMRLAGLERACVHKSTLLARIVVVIGKQPRKSECKLKKCVSSSTTTCAGTPDR